MENENKNFKKMENENKNLSLENRLIDLKRKNRNIMMIQGGLTLTGNVGGLIYAIKYKKSFWGKVGFWFLGGLIVGVPTGVTAYLLNSKRNSEIQKLTNH